MPGLDSLARKPFREPWSGAEGYRLFYNENLFLPREYYVELYRRLGDPEDTRFYSDPRNMEARMLLAKHLRIDPEMILLAPGVDALLSIIADAAKVLGWRVSVPWPTYGMYREKLAARRVPFEEPILEDSWRRLPLDRIRGDAVIICSPNNPTGHTYPRDTVEELLDRGYSLVVVDETYADYAGESLLDLVYKYDNLVLLRSFSKAWGLAGARIGAAIGQEKAIAGLEALSDPYGLPLQSRRLLAAALELKHYVEKSIRDTVEARERLYRGLEEAGVKPYPSKANFILFESTWAGDLLERLASRGFLLRGFEGPLGAHLRVTVPPSPILEGFLEALKETLEEVEEYYRW